MVEHDIPGKSKEQVQGQVLRIGRRSSVLVESFYNTSVASQIGFPVGVVEERLPLPWLGDAERALMRLRVSINPVAENTEPLRAAAKIIDLPQEGSTLITPHLLLLFGQPIKVTSLKPRDPVLVSEEYRYRLSLKRPIEIGPYWVTGIDFQNPHNP